MHEQLLRHASIFRRQLVTIVARYFDLEGCRKRIKLSRSSEDLLINFLQDQPIRTM